MQRRLICALATVIYLGGASTGAAVEESDYLKLSSFNAVQDRVTEAETRLAALTTPKSSHQEDDWVGQPTGLTFTAELLFLRPYEGETASQSQWIAAPRVTVGYVRCDGMGIRFRGFSFDSEQPGAADDYDVSYGDVELTDQFQLGCWQGTLGGGIRVGHYKETTNVDVIDFTGYGPVVGANLARCLHGNLHLIGGARYAALFGRDSRDDQRVTTTVIEMQLGTEYRKSIKCGAAQVFLRTVWETQYWNQISDDSEEDFALNGLALAIGLNH